MKYSLASGPDRELYDAIVILKQAGYEVAKLKLWDEGLLDDDPDSPTEGEFFDVYALIETL